jgi:hypothetical protein
MQPLKKDNPTEIKIKWIAEERTNNEIGKMETGHEYIVSSTLGSQLIYQHFAVEVKEDQPKKTEKK